MAGAVSEKFNPNVTVNVIYKNSLGITDNDQAIAPPNLYVDNQELGRSATQEQLEIIVSKKLEML